MIPIHKIDTLVAFLGLLVFVGALEATMTSFDPTAGGAGSTGNIQLQLASGLVYLSVICLMLSRIEKFLAFSKNNMILIGFLLVPLFSIFWSIAPDVTGRRSIALVGTSLFAMYIAFAVPAERLIRILAVVFGVTAIGSVVVIVALPTYGTHQFGEYAGLWRGLYSQKNEFGATMAMGAIVIFLCPKYTSYEHLLSRIAIAVCVFLMVMSESRAAWISFACVCIVAFAIRRISGRGFKTSVKTFLLLLVSFGIGSVVVMNANPLLDLVGKDPTLSGRTDVWASALDRAADRSFLGYGYRAYWIDGNKDRLMAEESWADNINHGHNTYLDLYVELGFLGIVTFSLTLFFLLSKLLSRIRHQNDYLNIWASGSICFILIRGTAESTILQHADINWVLFVYFFSVFAAYKRPVRHQPQAQRKPQDCVVDHSSPQANMTISRIFSELKRGSVRNFAQPSSVAQSAANAETEEYRG